MASITFTFMKMPFFGLHISLEKMAWGFRYPAEGKNNTVYPCFVSTTPKPPKKQESSLRRRSREIQQQQDSFNESSSKADNLRRGLDTAPTQGSASAGTQHRN